MFLYADRAVFLIVPSRVHMIRFVPSSNSLMGIMAVMDSSGTA